MNKASTPASIHLPNGWPKQIQAAILHVVSLVRFTNTRACAAAESDPDGNPFETQIERLSQEISRLREQLRIKDQRMQRIDPLKRPHYTPAERLEILEVRAARGWSRRQTAREFLIAATTVSTWLTRLDEQGNKAMLQVASPVNKFPELVSYAVQRIRTLCPAMGKVKIAETLCRAGLHLSASTVGRIAEQSQKVPPDDGPRSIDGVSSPASELKLEPVWETEEATAQQRVTAKHPNHVWHVDLTAVPITGGYWTTWWPNTLLQCWPFCWWVAIVMDHFSRKVIGFAVFKQQPTAVEVRTFLGRAMSRSKCKPKYLISDKGCQFWCVGYKEWCKRKGIKPRFGAIGQHGSIAIIERFNRTFKEITRSILVPFNKERFRRETMFFIEWFNAHRPHMALNGRTPDEMFLQMPRPANRQPRLEPRQDWPRGSPCAKPQTLVAGQPGDRFTININFHKNRSHLPILTLRRTA